MNVGRWQVLRAWPWGLTLDVFCNDGWVGSGITRIYDLWMILGPVEIRRFRKEPKA